MTTDQKGAIAETAVVHEAVKLGLEVYRPVAEGGRYDLIFAVGSRLVRVQCKWAPRIDDVLVVRCYSCRRGAHGLIQRPYLPHEIDAFAAYCADVDVCYFLPIERFAHRRAIQLRLAPTRNNQQRGIHWASDYEFAATLAAENRGP